MLIVEVIPYSSFKEKIAITRELKGKTVYIESDIIITEQVFSLENKEGQHE